MPIACSTSVITGSDGYVAFKFAGTEFCLVAEDFALGTPAKITVPVSHEFQVGDVVKIHPVGTATLDSGLTANSDGDAVVSISAVAAEEITVVEAADGSAITLAGDATGSDQANHFEISLSEFSSICSIKEYSLSLERESIDITTLPCKPCEGTGSKYASFRTTAPGYAAAEGSMTVLFSKDANSASNRLLANSMLQDQAGAVAKFYIDAVCGADGVDDSLSNYIEAPITLNGFEITVNTEDAVEATINFGFAGQPTALFGLHLS
nr:phage major tail protein 2 [uncultured Mediterranean phage uvMED]